MPVIQFNGPVLTKEKKAQVALKLTSAAHEILSEIPVEAFTVLIYENGPENVAVGGRLLAEKRKE